MSRHYPVIIVGGGQSGLSASYLLKERKIDHLILERKQVAPCLAEPAMEFVLPRDSKLAMPPAGISLFRR